MADLAESGATLAITGDGLDPSEVTGLLGGAPQRAERRGETLVLAGGGRRIAATGLWQRSAASRRPADPDAQVAELLADLADDPAVWQALAGRFAVTLHLNLFLDSANEALALSPATLTRLAARAIALRVEIYAPFTPAGSCGG